MTINKKYVVAAAVCAACSAVSSAVTFVLTKNHYAPVEIEETTEDEEEDEESDSEGYSLEEIKDICSKALSKPLPVYDAIDLYKEDIDTFKEIAEKEEYSVDMEPYVHAIDTDDDIQELLNAEISLELTTAKEDAIDLFKGDTPSVDADDVAVIDEMCVGDKGYRIEYWTWYSDDDMVVNERGYQVVNYQEYLGYDWKSYIGEMDYEDDYVWIRNDTMACEYHVMKVSTNE